MGEAREPLVQCLHSHSHTNCPLDSLTNMDHQPHPHLQPELVGCSALNRDWRRFLATHDALVWKELYRCDFRVPVRVLEASIPVIHKVRSRGFATGALGLAGLRE